MDRLSNFITFLKYSNLNFKLNHSLYDIVKLYSNINIYDTEDYHRNPSENLSHLYNKVLISLNNKNESQIEIEKDIKTIQNNRKPNKDNRILPPNNEKNIISSKKLDDYSQEDIIFNLQNELIQNNLAKGKDYRKKSYLNPIKDKDSERTNRKGESINDFNPILNSNELKFMDNLIIDDFDLLKKKSKLLEFIILKKMRNKYFLNKFS
jgi:hypothetical protein